jgi:hypothetical protein
MVLLDQIGDRRAARTKNLTLRAIAIESFTVVVGRSISLES